MDTTNKFFLKSISSFNSGKFYQAEREFDSGLLREIENDSFQQIEQYFNEVLPLLEKNSLNHESEQIIQYYLKHSRKHKNLEKALEPVVNFLKKNLTSNSNPNCTLSFFNGFMDFVSSNQESETNEYLKNNFQDILSSSIKFSYREEIGKKIFTTFILISLFKEAEKIADSNFLKDLNIEKNLDYILYSLVLLAINGNITKSMQQLQDLRKKIPIETQKNSIIFQVCSEFLLASSSKDYDWIKELQMHFTDSFKDKTLKLLIMNLLKNIFPDETKLSLFDLFK